MAYGEGGYKRSVWIPVVAVVLLLVIFVRPSSCSNRMATPASVEATLLSDAKYGRLLTTIKETYPDEMRRFVDHVTALIRNGASGTELSAENQKFMVAAAERHVRALIQAPAADLLAMNRAEALMVADLRKNSIDICAQYSQGGFRPGSTLPASADALSTELAIARWKASAAGRDRPANIKIAAELPENEYRTLAEGMRRGGLAPGDLDAFEHGRAATLPPAGQCNVVYHLTQALIAMPDEQELRFTRWLLSQEPAVPAQR
ncbi:hypothetical protein P1X14_07095 [Sphingomonas sp. AOB5]|uniref:hypothetical protein n=1 Tax=Sphingomonas sp. AOB5 TaxID=3034017 RepID=UPI0023F86308|nr:hypothetical protein [Sphingomonas sp. AOB5]MDF7775005.1 hypothetical protein [Sphingomonas sp. AOB5]